MQRKSFLVGSIGTQMPLKMYVVSLFPFIPNLFSVSICKYATDFKAAFRF